MNLQKCNNLVRLYCKNCEIFNTNSALCELKKISDRLEINPIDGFDDDLKTGV